MCIESILPSNQIEFFLKSSMIFTKYNKNGNISNNIPCTIVFLYIVYENVYVSYDNILRLLFDFSTTARFLIIKHNIFTVSLIFLILIKSSKVL